MPVTVLIQVLITGHVAGDVVGGFRAVFILIAAEGKLIKVVIGRQLPNLMIKLVGARKYCTLSGNYVV
jgi:hypothetical protein